MIESRVCREPQVIQAACFKDFSRAFFQSSGVNTATCWLVVRDRRSSMSFSYA